MSKPVIIAEAGVNHNGDIGRANEMIACAANAGADYIKFQAFSTDKLVAQYAKSAEYQAHNTGEVSQSNLLRGLEFDRDEFALLGDECRKHGIGFMATAFDIGMVEALLSFGMDKIKIASGELTNAPALVRFAKLERPILLSTGMASLKEVGDAVEILQKSGAEDITLLQCTSLYPAPFEALNLRTMLTMAQEFGLPVGFSDHSVGDHATIAAVALGACVIEKHFTLDRGLPGPDHAASLEPNELQLMVLRLHETYSALGTGIKLPTEAEVETAQLVRRSWHTQRPLKAGAVLTATDVILKRPASGMAPHRSPVGLTLRHPLTADVPVHDDDLVESSLDA